MNRTLLVSSDMDSSAAVSAVLSELDGFNDPMVLASAAQARLELQRQDVDIVLVDEAVEGGQGLAVMREIAALEPLIPVCLLSPRTDSEAVLRAIDSGARAVLPLPPSVERYAERLRSLSAWARAASGQILSERESLNRTVGRMAAVIGSKGGVGTSMIAMSAAKAAASRGHTALLDLDVRNGDLASYCGIRVRHSVADLVAVAAEVGGRELSEVAYPVRSGIELLPAPEHGELGEEMTEGATRQILQAMRYQYRHIIVDCGSHLDDATAAALDLADVIIIVATPEVPSLRAVRRLKETMDRLSLGQNTPIRIVLNRTSRHNEIQPAGAAKLVDSPILGVLPENGQRIEAAVNTGSLLELDLSPLTAIGRSIAELIRLGDSERSVTEGRQEVGSTQSYRRPSNPPARRMQSLPAFPNPHENRPQSSARAVPAPAPAARPISEPTPAPHPTSPARSQSYEAVITPQEPAVARRQVPAPAPSDEVAPLPASPVSAPLPPSLPPRRAASEVPETQLQQPRQPASGERRSRRALSWKRETGGSNEQGQTAVEFAGGFVVAMGLFFLCLELLLLGGSSFVAHNAAQEAARNFGVGMSHSQVVHAVTERMPSSWAPRTTVTWTGSNEVRVSIDPPGLMPGLGPASATARVDWER